MKSFARFAGLVAIVGVGCGDDVSPVDMTSVPSNFAQISAQILQPTCVSSQCHSDLGASPGNSDLGFLGNANDLNLCDAFNRGFMPMDLCGPTKTLHDAYAELVGVPAVNPMAHNMGLLRVKPCDPDNSFMIIKLLLPESATDPNVGYGEHMPNVAGVSLLPAQIQAIKDWISRGAHEDEPDSVSGAVCTPDADMSVEFTD
jgi:hypothetical protein